MLLRPCDDPRLLEGLRHACGPLIMGALEDPEVIEIMLNPDGSLWIERYGQDHDRIAKSPWRRAGSFSRRSPAGSISR